MPPVKSPTLDATRANLADSLLSTIDQLSKQTRRLQLVAILVSPTDRPVTCDVLYTGDWRQLAQKLKPIVIAVHCSDAAEVYRAQMAGAEMSVWTPCVQPAREQEIGKTKKQLVQQAADGFEAGWRGVLAVAAGDGLIIATDDHLRRSSSWDPTRQLIGAWFNTAIVPSGEHFTCCSFCCA